MNSRERIIETLNHREPDRVAIDLGATQATEISAIVYSKLKKLIGIDTGDIKVFGMMIHSAEVEPEVLERIGGDVVMLRRLAPYLGIPVRGWKPGKLTDGTDCLHADSYDPVADEQGNMVFYKITDGSDRIHPYRPNEDPGLFGKDRIVAKMPNGKNAFDRIYHPFEAVDSIEELDKFAFPEIDKEELEFLKKEAVRLYDTTDKAINGVFHGNVFEMGLLYWGYQKFFEMMASEPELVLYFMEKRTDAYLRDLKKYLDTVGRYIHTINFLDDLGTQAGPMISPKMYRELIKPFHMKMYGFVRNNYPNVKVFMHCCGAIYDMIPDLIEAGVQVLNPVQVTASGMDPAKLKKEFGRDLVFWGGGVDTQQTLNFGTVDQVRGMAGEMLDIFSPGGGYVFSQVHCIDSDIPAENVLAAFETAKNYKRKVKL